MKQNHLKIDTRKTFILGKLSDFSIIQLYNQFILNCIPEKNSRKLMSDSNCLVSLVVGSSAKSRLCPLCLFIRKDKISIHFIYYHHWNIFLYYSVLSRITSPSLSFSTLNFIQICVITVSQVCHMHTCFLYCHAVLFFGTILYLFSEYFFSVAPSLHNPA